jgi:N-acetylglucosamine-6-phosphate deacetylase
MLQSSYFDLQINGYNGVDFNQESMTADDLYQACKTLERDQVEGILATIITDDIELMSARLARIVELRATDKLIKKMIVGFHIEGPFISTQPGYVGAHPIQHAKQANWDDMAQLLDAADGLTMLVTLAPEQDPQQQVTRKLAANGILVAAGHTDATLAELDASIDAGLSLFTHLGNGCPRLMDRHDNIIQRALSRADHLHFGLIADGAHIPFFTLKNYLDLVGIDRAFVVSDAISAAGRGPGVYPLGHRFVTVGEDGVPRADDNSHLVGSATILKRMADNLRDHCGLTTAEIERLTLINPRQLFRSTASPALPANGTVNHVIRAV